jgi:branched-chain amino acid transport system permease protein
VIKGSVLGSSVGWLVLALAAAIVLPLVVGIFWVHVLTEILIMGLFATSFNLLFGYMGQLSFGQAAYYGIGAYTTALMMTKASLPLPLCMAGSILLAGLFALIFGYFCVRLTGIYFAILTMAFGQLVFYVIFQWYSFTGGDNGIQGIPVPSFLQDAYTYYYFTLGMVIAALVVMRFITESPFGYTLRAIRDNSDRTRFLGINIRRYMLINFIIAGMFAGLAGSLWAPFNRSIAPDLSNWAHSGIPVFMAVIGGPLGFFGPMVGSLVYTFLSAFVTGFTEYWPLVIGIIIIFIVLFLPGGILGTLQMRSQPAGTNHPNTPKDPRG